MLFGWCFPKMLWNVYPETWGWLMIHDDSWWWFTSCSSTGSLIGGLGAQWFGFLGSPYERDCYLWVSRFESQTTQPQTTNQPLVDFPTIWKGSHNPRNRGRKRSPWLWTTYVRHGMILQVSNEKNLGWLGYIGDYTTQWYRDDYNKPS